ncbi:MAG: hypothetical protein K6T16_03240 [Candidatus Pacearchaeota archaeon]|nr:hypothetical protein [Candidatus Pacearchaeota archaeon]
MSGKNSQNKISKEKIEKVKETLLSDECVWHIVVLAKGEAIKDDPAFKECYRCIGNSSSCAAYTPFSAHSAKTSLDKTSNENPNSLEETLEKICFWKNIAAKKDKTEIARYPGLINCYECDGKNKKCKNYSISDCSE